MTVANDSYITDIAELFLYTDERYIRKLATRKTETEPDEELTGARLDRIHLSMNTASRRMDNLWRFRYDLTTAGRIVDSVVADDPSLIVKNWVARLTVHYMEVLSGKTGLTEALKELLDEIITALSVASDEVFANARGQQVMPLSQGGDARRGTLFDEGGLWDNVVPTDEQDGFIT